MITVEVPLRKIDREVERLSQVEGHYSEMYARGAIDALKWLKDNTPAPSEGENFPLLYKGEV